MTKTLFNINLSAYFVNQYINQSDIDRISKNIYISEFGQLRILSTILGVLSTNTKESTKVC